MLGLPETSVMAKNLNVKEQLCMFHSTARQER